MRVLASGLALLGAAAAFDLESSPAVTQQLVDTINSMGTTWKAAVPAKFQNGEAPVLACVHVCVCVCVLCCGLACLRCFWLNAQCLTVGECSCDCSDPG